MGLSAFFWVPAALQRGLLSDAAFKIARDIFMPENVWTWRSFVDTTLGHIYSLDIPFRLGLVQLTLALVGAVFVRRRDGEWLFFVGLAILSGLAIFRFTLPIWLSNPVLIAVQFPWRLLTVTNLAIALLTAGIVARPRARAWQAGIGLVVLAVMIAANRPVVPPLQAQPGDEAAQNLAGVVLMEAQNGNTWGTTSTNEFLPKWVDPDHGLTPEAPFYSSPAAQLTGVSVRTAGPNELSVDVKSQEPGPLRVANFYFPGWQATLDGSRRLVSYPSTNLGLLTVDVPAGEHRLRFSWVGTPAVRLAGALSVVALAWLAWCCWRWGTHRWTALVPALLLAVVGVSALLSARTPGVYSPVQALSQDGLTLSGYRWETAEAGQALYVYPYWYVGQTPRDDWAVEWELRNSAQQRVASVKSRPYFGSRITTNWPVATVVDDAYRIALPPDLPAGVYHLALRFTGVRDDQTSTEKFTEVGDVQLAATPSRSRDQLPQHALALKFGDSISLTGYDVRTSGVTMPTGKPEVVSVSPGSVVTYGLAWRSTRSLLENYHGFVHLVDGSGQVLTGKDKQPDQGLQPSLLWDPYRDHWDRLMLQIPSGDSTQRLYWPRIGLYQHARRR